MFLELVYLYIIKIMKFRDFYRGGTMWGRKAIILALVVSTITSVANADLTIMPYFQRTKREKTQSLKLCPSGAGLMAATKSLPDKDKKKGKDTSFRDGHGNGTIMRTDSVIDVD